MRNRPLDDRELKIFGAAAIRYADVTRCLFSVRIPVADWSWAASAACGWRFTIFRVTCQPGIDVLEAGSPGCASVNGQIRFFVPELQPQAST
jgi:hypothetical protein